MVDAVVMETSLETFPVRRGKVRDIYDLGDQLLLGEHGSHQCLRLGVADRNS